MQAEQALEESKQRAEDGRVPSQDARGPKVLSSEYIDSVSAALHKDKEQFGAERRRAVAEQEGALRRVQRVLESRLRSVAPSLPSAGVAFSSSLDDAEAVLKLMLEVDADDSGSISEKELLESSALTPEMRKALESAFGCDEAAMEEALAHLEARDFGDYCQGMIEGGGGSDGPAFDAKASARAVFVAALGPSGVGTGEAVAANAPGPAATADATRCSQRATKADLEKLAASLGEDERTLKLAAALTSLANTLLEAGGELDFLAVSRAARQVPRVAGQRMEWVRGMSLDAELARHLPVGTLDDGLAGIRAMPLGDMLRALDAFVTDVRLKILAALLEAKTATGSKSAHAANSKFEGFEGSFASLREFHAGAEATL